MGFEYLTNVPLAQARKEYLERLVSGGLGQRQKLFLSLKAAVG